jgi:hypothetical protein
VVSGKFLYLPEIFGIARKATTPYFQYRRASFELSHKAWYTFINYGIFLITMVKILKLL